MAIRRKMLAVLITLLFTTAMIFADGLFYQAQAGGGAIDSSYTAQLGIPTTGATATTIPANAVLQAIGNSEYPVTPGDTFLLSYSDGKNLISLNLQADSSCRVSIQSVGVVEAAGMTYSEFKDHVENLISTYYNYSAPQVQILSCGVFSVRVHGEVSYSQYVTAWGLTRLSDMAIYALDSASTRTVEVTYRDGSVKTYDLFNALRNGSAEDNPLLAPGCEVRFLKASAVVSLDGSVARAGVYQPKEGDTLYSLIQDYAGGLLGSADAQSIRISNYADGAYSARYVSLEDSKSYTPANGDVISVVHSSQNLPYVTVSGAIVPEAGSDDISSANRTMYSFIPGETVQQLLSNISSMLTSTSDAGAAYILRDGSRIAVAGKDIAL
ncbi:MAG: polysaccharide biosynthesis/export family protein, partial [Spirochaetales bacterium]|nr:polysaccharide biosynthesis/export family protein [Spirochaetales bacterium]